MRPARARSSSASSRASRSARNISSSTAASWQARERTPTAPATPREDRNRHRAGVLQARWTRALDTATIRAVTRLKQVRIALIVVAFANVAIVIADWPHPSTLTEIGTLITCGGSLLLSYRESPSRFHRRVGPREALGLLLVPVALIGIGLGLNALNTGSASGRATTAPTTSASPVPALTSPSPSTPPPPPRAPRPPRPQRRQLR